MPDPGAVPPAPDPASSGVPRSIPSNRARFGRVDGIIDGRVADAAAIRSAVKKANGTGYSRLILEIDGGRFSILPEAAPIPAARMTPARRAAFFEGLCELVAACDGPAESTLRSTEVFDGVVHETLFVPGPDGRSLRALTRERPVTPEDLARVGSGTRPSPAIPAIPVRLVAILMPLLIVAIGLMAWTGGWIDRAFSTEASRIRVDTAVFGDLLSLEVTNSWGDHVVGLRRGRAYPRILADIERLRQEAGDPARRLVVDVVADGGPIWLRLEDKDGRGLAASRVDLRALVESEVSTVRVRLPGHRQAACVRIALSSGEGFQ